MNIVNLIGNLTRDPDVRYTTGANQTAVARFSIAVNDGYGDKKRVDYPNIVVFGKQAENCQKYLHKGSKVAITGRIQTGSYEKDGRKIYTTDVIANSVEYLKTEQVVQEVERNELPPQTPEGFTAMSNDDLPF